MAVSREHALKQEGLEFRREAARLAELLVQVAGDLAQGLELRRYDRRPVDQPEELHLNQTLLTRARAEVEDFGWLDPGGEGCLEQPLAGGVRAEWREEELSQCG